MTVEMSRDDNGSEPPEAALLRVASDLWRQLEELRRGHGSPTYVSIAKQIQRPKSTVSEWFTKRTVVPDWPDFERLLTALGCVEPGEWRMRWQQARTAQDERLSLKAKRPRNGDTGTPVEPPPSDAELLVPGGGGHDHADGLLPDAVGTDRPGRTQPGPPVQETPPPAIVTATTPRLAYRRTRRYALAASVVIGIAALFAVPLFIGDAHQPSDPTTLEQQRQQQQAETLRVKREQVYQDYLTAANALADATDAYIFQCPDATRTILAAFNCTSARDFTQHYKNYEQADATIRIYWSPTVKRAVEATAQLLPTVNGHFDDGKLHGIDRSRLENAQKDLRHAICADIQIGSNQACE